MESNPQGLKPTSLAHQAARLKPCPPEKLEDRVAFPQPVKPCPPQDRVLQSVMGTLIRGQIVKGRLRTLSGFTLHLTFASGFQTHHEI